MEKTYLGLEKNVAFCLSYLIQPIAIVILVIEKDLTREERVELVAIILSIAAAAVTCSLYFWIFNLITAIKCFSGDFDFKLPICQNIAESIMNDY